MGAKCVIVCFVVSFLTYSMDSVYRAMIDRLNLSRDLMVGFVSLGVTQPRYID